MDAPPSYNDACDAPEKLPPKIDVGGGSDTPTEPQAWELGFKHVVLVSAMADSEGFLTQRCIHHWDHGSPSTSFAMPTNIEPAGDMRHVSGFHELGSFSIPVHRGSTPERHAFLSQLAGQLDADASAGASQQGAEADRALADHIVTALGIMSSSGPAPPPGEEGAVVAEMRLYSMEIGTRGEHALEAGKADAMVWNWAKPDSLYLTQGAWYATIDEAVVDGAWRGGRGFSVSVEVVGEEAKMRMFEAGRGR